MRRMRFEAPDGAVHDAVVDGNVCVSDSDPELRVAVLDVETLELPEPYRLRRPLDPPEVWCAGVTYERSRDARIEESGRDVYALVYDADRPELFLKDAGCRRTVGPEEPVAVRADSSWNVPEPEIGLVLGERGAIAGVTIGNDVSSRDIEGANPLYLPQAKVYAGACAVGPAVLTPAGDSPFELTMRILGEDGAELWSGSTSTARMRRTFAELVEWLLRDNPVPPGSILLTGTGLVPPDGISLRPGHVVEIDVPGIGRLRNPVVSAHKLLERSLVNVRDADRNGT
jgi:2-dehydro-3-deoxy-D-arabinonate dehydratase